MQKVNSAYTKTNNPTDFIRNSEVLYTDKKRTIRLLRTVGFQMPIELRRSGSIGSISYKGQNVNVSGEDFASVFNDNKTKFSDRDSEGNTLTKEQQEYFKDSKIRDEDGNLLIVYHGTDSDFTVFDKTKGRSTMNIQGSFFSPWDLDAQGYGSNVKAYYLNIKNPAPQSVGYKALNKFKVQNNAGVKARQYLESLGYDGVNNGNEEYIAFNSEQIKLIDNKTPTSDPNNGYTYTIKIADNKKIKASPAKADIQPLEVQATPSINSIYQNSEKSQEISQKISQKISSAKTSIKQVPALFHNPNVVFGKTNVDIGGGRFDLATEYLAKNGTKNYIFDPFNRGEEENSATLEFVKSIGADTSTCANVLNVIAEDDARRNVILETAKAIKQDGTAYFTVYEGDGSGVGRETSSGWQNNRKTADYVGEIEEFFDNVTRKGKLIIATEPKSNLPQAYWETSLDNVKRYSDRNLDLDTRTLLANALESVTQNEDEKNLLNQYKTQIEIINKQQNKLTELRKEIKDISFGKNTDRSKLPKLQKEANALATAITKQDKKLLDLEANKHIKDVFAREKAFAKSQKRKRI